MGLLNFFKTSRKKKDDIIRVPIYSVEAKIVGCRFECDKYSNTNRQQVVELTKVGSKLRIKKRAYGEPTYYVLAKYRGAWVDSGVLPQDLTEMLENKYGHKAHEYEGTVTSYYFTYGKNYQYDCEDCKRDCGDCSYKAEDKLKIGLKIRMDIYEK